MMTQDTRVQIVEHAARWAQNMLVEVLSNHGSALTEEGRDCLHNAVRALVDLSSADRSRR